MHFLMIRAIGKPHEAWQKEAIHTYIERLGSMAKIQLIELPEGHQGSAKPNEEKTRRLEAESLLKSLPASAWVIALDETGQNLSSTMLAKKMSEWSAGGRPVVFLIGGSWGLDSSIKERAHHVLSFGKHTLPHLLARITLLEQLYRAEMILSGKTYHK
ncbi:23S rRNA (pseudouridine(1915)-N(3))-methyltransferase RlmH [Candidatus Uhrbacteria bacterium]|nr:23S rRNA (pseudouridine(1915)-N(3))-methyltransferase RlmH [Candidatus Uhrbacteria bacterium]